MSSRKSYFVILFSVAFLLSVFMIGVNVVTDADGFKRSWVLGEHILLRPFISAIAAFGCIFFVFLLAPLILASLSLLGHIYLFVHSHVVVSKISRFPKEHQAQSSEP